MDLRVGWSGVVAVAGTVAVVLVAAAAGATHRGTFQMSKDVEVVEAQLRWVELAPQPRTTSRAALVVEGKLRNVSAGRSALIRVRATFLDAAGAELLSATGYPHGWGIPGGGEERFLVVAPPNPRIASVLTRVEEAPEPGLAGLTVGAVLEGLRT